MRHHLAAILLTIAALNVAPLTNAVTITTWNLQHMMSEATFDEWAAFCRKYDWDEDKVKVAGVNKPKHLTYCNAHNGLLYPTTVSESKPLQTPVAFAEKVGALSKRRAELNSDLFALQEVGDEAAVRRIFPAAEWDVVVSEAPIPQNIAFAVRKKGPIKIVSSKQIDSLAQTDDGGHRVRPGLELTVDIKGRQITLLNVHLKASCRSQPISDPQRPGYADDKRWEEIQQGCKVLRKQVPELESWVEAQTRAGHLYIILGDWNRDLKRDLSFPARLDGQESAKAPITPTTRIGSLMKEVSDNEPRGAWLAIVPTSITARSKSVKAPDARKYDKVCHEGIDNFAISDSMMKALSLSKEKLKATGADYGAEAYGIDRAMPSDHCPVTLLLAID